MTVVYIIGNGFDRWHGLPTSYSHFYAYAKDVLDDMEQYFDPGKPDCLWAEFEKSLGTYDWRMLYEQYDHTDVISESFKVSETYGLHDELAEQTNELHTEIEECFREWVQSIEVTKAFPQMRFTPDSHFISFNYTPTLQVVYGVAEASVLHIHGRAGTGSLVFGHGVKIEEERELDENGDSNRTMFTDAENTAKYPLYAFQKQTADVIRQNHAYFESLVGLSRIEVIGHSLADVDLPYFMAIAKRNSGCIWIVYWHIESEVDGMIQQLQKCGVCRDMIATRPFPTRPLC